MASIPPSLALYKPFIYHQIKKGAILLLAMKDVERCFGVLQARFAIIKNPSRHWNVDFISNIMFTCCILHNMILENEQDVEGLEDIIAELQQDTEPLNRGLSFQELLAGTIELENRDTHFNLRGDLIEHLWRLKGLNMA
jgi:hypothetical protein